MDNKYSSENQKMWSEDMKNRTAEARAEYPELPHEFTKPINGEQLLIDQMYDELTKGLTMTIRDMAGNCTTIAQTYYNSIIEWKDKEIGELRIADELNVSKIEELQQQATQYFSEADHWETMFITADMKLQGQKAEIERITELLKEEIMNNAYTYYAKRRANLLDANNMANDKWNKYKKEHNL